MRLLVAKSSAAFNKLIGLGVRGGPLKSMGGALVFQTGPSLLRRGPAPSRLQPERAPPASPSVNTGPEHCGATWHHWA